MFDSNKKGVNRKRFGFCIYCGSRPGEQNLTDEHALPSGLEGKQILEKASCLKCQKETSRIEAVVQRHILGEYRFYKGFKSGSRHKNLPKKQKRVIKTNDGKVQERELQLKEYGVYLLLPEFAEPRILYPNPKITGVEIKGFHFFNANAKTINRPEDISEILVQQNFKTEEFVKFLYKVTYCYTCLSIDPSSFYSPIKKMITGKAKIDYRFVGSPQDHLLEDKGRTLCLFNQDGIIFCDIKLFNDIPVIYRVVVGYELNFRKVLKRYYTAVAGSIKSFFSPLISIDR